VKFSPKIAYGNDNCSVYIINPWLINMQNGFGVFISRKMDCSSIVTIDCLPDSILINQIKNFPVQFTCHTSENRVEIPCSSISITFKRNIKMGGTKESTFVQVVALAKEPCIDDDLFFQCRKDYPNSCIDKALKCNGQSECPSGEDERGCHPKPAAGIPVIVIILLILAFLTLICVLSTVLICCCCRAACNKIIRRFRSKHDKKGDVTVTGEDAGLMKGLTAPTTVVEVLPQQSTEPTSLVIDSTKPIYPRLE